MPFKWLPDPRDEVMSRVMVDLWTNFAIYHEPTPKDEAGNFIGKSLVNLERPWRRSKKKPNGLMDYIVLKDGKVSFKAEENVEARLKWLIDNVVPKLAFYD
jgi:hypothetical protein